MIIVEKAKNTQGVLLSGDFFDFDRLYFAIVKFTGTHGINDECPFPGGEIACENLLGLCYELRHAWQGERNIVQVYNGISRDWFDSYKVPTLLNNENVNHDNEELSDYDDFDNEVNYVKKARFSRSEFPYVAEKNTYFSMLLRFPEVVFYALLLSDLLKKKELFIQSRKRMAEATGASQGLYKEYYYFQAEEDIARMTLFTKHTLHTLYRFIGEEKYNAFMSVFNKINDFYITCNLRKINDLIVEYGEKEYAQDDPDTLLSVLTSFLE